MCKDVRCNVLSRNKTFGNKLILSNNKTDNYNWMYYYDKYIFIKIVFQKILSIDTFVTSMKR